MTHEADIMKAITNRFGEGYEITRQVTNKGNGVILHGYAIKESGSNVSSIVYVDKYVGAIQSGAMTTSALAEIVWISYSEHKKAGIFNVNDLSKEKILRNIVPRLVPRDGNDEYLQNLEWRSFLDIAVTYKYKFDHIESASMNITKEIAEYFGITEDELYNASIRNSRISEGYCIMSMEGVMKELAELGAGGDDIDLDECWNPEMYVATNKSRVHGATAVLHDEVLKVGVRVCRGSYYLLPSSVHEFLMVPEPIMDPESLKELVRTVNSTEVDPIDFLSNSVYRYDAKKGTVEIVK